MNKRKISVISILAIVVIAFTLNGYTKEKEPWSEKQLLKPADLVKSFNDPDSKKPILLSIGFDGGIAGSIVVGAARDKEGIENLKKELAKLPKDADIVIYCGCCPYDKCPNVRPAFNLINEMKFTNHKLLDLPHNLKTDWINKGYPMSK